MKPRVVKLAGIKGPSFPYRAIMKIIAVAIALLSVVSSQAANIVWVSFHSGDDTPTANAISRGYTRAPDVGYTELLRNSGHTVTRIVTRDNVAAGSAEDALIQAADLVIISRSVNSGHYQADNETAYWNGLTKPLILINGYVSRGGATANNVRLGYLQSSTIPDVNSASVRLQVNDPSHPVFAGVALDGANLMVNPYAHMIVDAYGTHRGISVVTGNLAGGGTVLATVGTAGDAAFGGAVVAEWQAGATMDTAASGTQPNVNDILGGRRLLLLTGSREPNITGTSSEVAGIYDLDPDGARMFLNAVDYMAPPPTYDRAVLADGPIVYYRFSDAGTTAANAGTLGAAGDGTYLNGAVSGTEAPRSPQFVGFEADNVAAQLDGVDDFVQGPMRLLNNLSNVTLSAWIRRAGTQRDRTGIIGQDNVVEFGYINNNTLQAWVDDFTTPIDIPTPFPDLEWDHVALVVDGAALRMTTYTNGQAGGTAPLPSAFYDSLNSQTPLVVGGDAFGGTAGIFRTFNGQIDEAAVFDKALTADQVANHYYSAVASPPIVTRQPQGTNLFEGETIVLSVGAVGTPNLRYQWLYFGGPIAGQTSSTLTIPNALPEHSGTYAVQIENAYGMVFSADAEVNVQPTQPPIITQEPQDVRRYEGRTATFSVTAIGGSNLEYQWTHEGMNLVDETNSTLTINNVSAANQGVYQVTVKNAVGETPSALAELIVLTPTAGSYEALVTSGNPLAYWRLGEGSGTIAYDAWGGFDGTYSNVTLAVPGAIVGDTDTAALFAGSAVRTPLSLNSTPAFTIVGWFYRTADQTNRTGLWGQNDKVEIGYIDNNTMQIWTDNALNIAPNPIPNEQWGFFATVSEGSPGVIRAYTNGISAGQRNHTLPANGAFTFNIGGGGIFDATANNFQGRLDEVAVYNRALSADEIAALYFSGAAAPPIITGQPQGTNLFEGGTINVCVTAFGSAPLTYQWYYFGAPITGQNGPCLNIPNATPGDSGDYFVEVTNPHGTVMSVLFTIDVRPASPPVITQHPQSATRYAGASVTLTGAATGTEPITYQWTKDGSDIPGATSSSLTLNNLQASDAGSYRLVAMNFIGTATSDPATLTIISAPPGSYTAAVLAEQPIAYWRLGESSGTTAFDHVGGNHGTYNNVALGQPGAITGDPDTAAGFDGISSYVGTPVSLNGLTSLTMVGWIRRNGPQENRTGLFGQNDVVEFGYINNDTIQAWVDNFNQAVNITPNPIPDQRWGFVALTLDNGALTVQVNNDPDGTVNLGSSNYGSSADTFNIGGGGIFDAIAANGNYFDGQIDEVALFNRALTTAELNELYALGANECPTAADVNVSVNQNGTANFNLSGADANGDALTYTVTQPPAHGTVTVQISTGAATYTPAADYCGPDSFQYTVSDGRCSSAAATVNITVVDTTPPTVTCPGNLEVLSPAPTPVTYNASATDNCGLASFDCSPPSGSTFPMGATTVTCTAVSGGGTASCSFTVTVRSPNDPPVCAAALAPEECVINGNSIVSLDGQQACITLDGSASSDPNGDPLTFQWTVAGQFTVDMDAAQEPQGGGTGTGSGTVSLSGNTLTINVAFSGMTANATAMHIHGPAGIGTNASVFYGLEGIGTLGATEGTISGNITLVEGTRGFTIAQQLEQLRNGLWYINIHSSFKPGGEIRGQILPIVLGSGATADVCLGLGCHSIELAVSDGQATTRCAIDVCVIDAGDALEQCIELVDNVDIGRKNKRPLIASLKAAQASFDRGSLESGLNQLKAYQNKVRAQIEPNNPAAAAALLDCVNEIVEAVGCGVLAE